MSHAMRPWEYARWVFFMLLLLYALMCVDIGVQAAAVRRAIGATRAEQLAVGLYAAALPLSKNPPSWYSAPVTISPGRFQPRVSPPFEFTRGYRGYYEWPSAESIRAGLATRNPRMLAGWVWLANFWHMHAIVVAMSVPVAFLLLPVTRSRVVVHPTHLYRITAYSMVIPFFAIVFPFLLGRFAMFVPALWPFLRPLFRTCPELLPMVGVPLLLMWWWRCAFAHHLRLPHAGAAAMFLVFVSWLAVSLMLVVPAALLP